MGRHTNASAKRREKKTSNADARAVGAKAQKKTQERLEAARSYELWAALPSVVERDGEVES